MKTTQPTYINLKPEIEPDEPKLSPLDFHVRRDARIVVKYEVRKYTIFAGKTALNGLKTAIKGIGYGLTDMIEHAERQRLHKTEMAKQGVEVKYTFF